MLHTVRAAFVVAGCLASFLLGVVVVEHFPAKTVLAQQPTTFTGRGFYLTTDRTYSGATAGQACAAGHHMASLWEIHDVSALSYEANLGFTYPGNDFQIGGPPSISNNVDGYGWIRGGGSSNPTTNCNGWTSNSNAVKGMVLGLANPLVWNTTSPSLPGNYIAPWAAYPAYSSNAGLGCASTMRVWCVRN
jgi:hypothetical protein